MGVACVPRGVNGAAPIGIDIAVGGAVVVGSVRLMRGDSDTNT